MNDADILRIRQFSGIDLSDPAVRRRAWRRLRVFQELIAESEADRNQATADWLRSICQRATQPEPDLLCLAILAGPERSIR